MNYDLASLSNEQITNLYLYGQPDTPSDLSSDTLLRGPEVADKDPAFTVVSLDAVSFMSEGPGRFALGPKAPIVTAFMTGTSSAFANTGARQVFTMQQMIDGLGIPEDDFKLSLRQFNYGDSADDYGLRVYIYNSSGFTISKDALFVIEADGTRHIENYKILPFDDNFDFKSDSFLASLGNPLLEPLIDPSGIGRRVDIIFEDASKDQVPVDDYTLGDYLLDVAKLALTFNLDVLLPSLPFEMLQVANTLWDGGMTKTLYQGKAIIYGTNDAETLSASQLDDLPLLSDLKAYGKANGVALIAGGGNDTLNGGVNADYLQGGEGDDTLIGGTGNDLLVGGQGNDTYIYRIGDGFDTLLDTDGVGQIQWENLVIKGSDTTGLDHTQWQQLSNTVWQDQANHIIYSLKTQADGSQTLFINRVGDELRIDQWVDGSLGITLGAGSVAPLAIHIYNGDQRALLIGSEIDPAVLPSNSSFNTYKWSATSWAADGTLTGGVVQANFNDVIVGSVDNDSINGLGGNDALDGGLGNDTLDGGAGNDLIAGGAWSDIIFGGAGNDMILSATGLSVPQRQGLGDDWQTPSGKTVWIKGSNWGVTEDVNGNYIIYGGGTETQDNAPDIIFAGDGDDRVVGGRGDDYIDGGLGNDKLVGHGGNDIIDGGDGDDVIQGDGKVSAGSYETVAGANHGNDILDGGAGADIIIGGGKHDVLFGGIGNDFLWGDGQTETYLTGQYHGNDYLDGGDGDDQLIGGGKEDTLFGGIGNDLLWGDDTNETNLPGQYHGNDYLDGGEGNDQLVGGGKDDTLIGGGGNDTLFGDASVSKLALLYHGNDYLDGGEGDDQLVGGGGNDILLGGAGVDLLLGEGGNDTLEGGDGDDELQGGDGNDVLDGGAGDDLLFGEAGDDALYGGDGNDELYGEDGNDLLEGGAGADYLFGENGNDTLLGGAGADYLNGGSGNDTYVVDNSLDYVDEALNQGIDTVQSSITYMLGANIENLVLTGTTAINGTGNALNNVLTGNSAANMLTGGAGNDTYVIGTGDRVVEAADAGTDTVQSSVTYTLTNNVENLTLIGSIAINGTGNALDNVLTGNSAANKLSGGTGADTLMGGAGNDSYYIDNAGDTVVENAGEGNDIIYSSITHTLGANLERLYLTGTAAVSATGNELNNTLYGQANSAGNLLSGGLGNDAYYAGNGDTVIENAGEGTDSVYSYGDYTLNDNLENLYLNVAAAAMLIGNDLANTINGNLGNDNLNGGIGNDTLNGGAGDDSLNGGAGNDALKGGEGADLLIGGAGKDTYNLAETSAATDVLRIAAGDSLVTGFDVATGFRLGSGIVSTAGVDQLDLDSTLIAANATKVDGMDSGVIRSHHVFDGIISFDDINAYTSPLAITAGNLTNVFGYLQNNITARDTVAFNALGNTYVFQDGGVDDTLVQLTGVTASSISTTGSATHAVWIV